VTADDFRKASRKIGARRRRLRREQEDLREDTETMLKSRPAGVSISEACELVGISRSSFYEDFDLA
jgi:hypothetical protein